MLHMYKSCMYKLADHLWQLSSSQNYVGSVASQLFNSCLFVRTYIVQITYDHRLAIHVADIFHVHIPCTAPLNTIVHALYTSAVSWCQENTPMFVLLPFWGQDVMILSCLLLCMYVNAIVLHYVCLHFMIDLQAWQPSLSRRPFWSSFLQPVRLMLARMDKAHPQEWNAVVMPLYLGLGNPMTCSAAQVSSVEKRRNYDSLS
jgi:hypothetical protein